MYGFSGIDRPLCIYVCASPLVKSRHELYSNDNGRHAYIKIEAVVLFRAIKVFIGCKLRYYGIVSIPIKLAGIYIRPLPRIRFQDEKRINNKIKHE